MEYFNTTHNAWLLLEFPHIDTFVKKAWEMNRSPDEL